MYELASVFVAKINYWIYIVLMMIGFYAVIVKKNLVKKVVGMNILQTAIILFFISIGAKSKTTIPIIEHGGALHQSFTACIDADSNRCCCGHPGRCTLFNHQNLPAVSYTGRG